MTIKNIKRKQEDGFNYLLVMLSNNIQYTNTDSHNKK